MNAVVHLACCLAAYISASVLAGVFTQAAIFFRVWPLMISFPALESAITDTIKNTFKLAVVVPLYLTYISLLQGRSFKLREYFREQGLFSLRPQWHVKQESRMSASLLLYCLFLFSLVQSAFFVFLSCISVLLNSWSQLMTSLASSSQGLQSDGHIWSELLKNYIESLRVPPQLGVFALTYGFTGSPVNVAAYVVASAALAFFVSVYGPQKYTLVKAYLLAVVAMSLSQAAVSITTIQLHEPFRRSVEAELRNQFGGDVVEHILNIGGDTLVVTRPPGQSANFIFTKDQGELRQFYDSEGPKDDVIFMAKVQNSPDGSYGTVSHTNASGNDLNWKLSLLFNQGSAPRPKIYDWLLFWISNQIRTEVIIFLSWAPLSLLLMATSVRLGRKLSRALLLKAQINALPAADASKLEELLAHAAGQALKNHSGRPEKII